VRFENACSKSEVYPITLPLQIGAQNHLFRRLRHVTATLTGYTFGTKNDVHNRASALETTMGPHTSSQNAMNSGPQTA